MVDSERDRATVMHKVSCSAADLIILKQLFNPINQSTLPIYTQNFPRKLHHMPESDRHQVADAGPSRSIRPFSPGLLIKNT